MTRVRIAVIGSGAWGIALALHSAGRGADVRIVCPRRDTARRLRETRERLELLPGVRIPVEIQIADFDSPAALEADCWIVAVPTAHLRESLAPLRESLRPRRGVVSLTKGLEIGSFLRPTEILLDLLGPIPRAALSGPSHAEEVAGGLPTSLVAASANDGFAVHVQETLGTERLRIYTSHDLLGVELAGALKNVYAIAAGVSDGLGLGDNAKAALMTRSLVEMTRFGTACGAEAATFAGLAGLGDLAATCFSRHGRNRRAGERIARGAAVSEVVAGPQVIEGFFTAKSVRERSRAMNVELPIADSVFDILYEGKPPQQAVRDLMTRRQRPEDAW